jgi:hypothetical protein
MTHLSADGQSILGSTYFGGESSDAIWDVRADSLGFVHVAGDSFSRTLPGIPTDAIQTNNAGSSDILIARMASDGSLSTTFYGSTGEEIAYGVGADAAGNTYAVGRVTSVSFPVSSTNVRLTPSAAR